MTSVKDALNTVSAAFDAVAAKVPAEGRSKATPFDPVAVNPEASSAAVQWPCSVNGSIFSAMQCKVAALTGTLIPFDTSNARQKGALQDLGAYLKVIGFDAANRAVHGYNHSPIYDNEESLGTIDRKLEEKHLALTPQQKTAVSFFKYGKALTAPELHALFDGHAELLNELQRLRMVSVKETAQGTTYRLNGLSLESRLLPNGEVLHLFVDIPKRLDPEATHEPTAQISSTSYNLLGKLEADYEDGGKRYSGVAADLGSGTGIQALALLKMHPALQEVIAAEIDPHSINLTQLNAMLNGVSDRMTIVDNADPENFQSALGGRKLDLVVSNPPFNVVPHQFADQFTDFGDGGDQGLDVTKIFLKQALPVLKPGGEFIMYSVLAMGKDETPILKKVIDDDYHGLDVSYLGLPSFENCAKAECAMMWARWLVQHSKDPGLSYETVKKEWLAGLEASGVEGLSAIMVTITKRGGWAFQNDHHLQPAMKLTMPEPIEEPVERRGGVYTTISTYPKSIFPDKKLRSIESTIHDLDLQEKLQEKQQEKQQPKKKKIK